MRFRVRRKVDFPHPDGPMSAVTRWPQIFTETSRKAWKLP
jgi:hypothetical protein